jgi:hypothetical protein
MASAVGQLAGWSVTGIEFELDPVKSLKLHRRLVGSSSNLQAFPCFSDFVTTRFLIGKWV